MSDVMYVTKESFEKIRQELHHKKSVERPAASRAIAEAREKGDLKENAEYDAAKEAQGMLEAKIQLLESQIASARIMETREIDTSKVSILTTVTITNVATKKNPYLPDRGRERSGYKGGENFCYIAHWEGFAWQGERRNCRSESADGRIEI